MSLPSLNSMENSGILRFHAQFGFLLLLFIERSSGVAYVTEEPLYYIALVGRKLAPIPLHLLEECFH